MGSKVSARDSVGSRMTNRNCMNITSTLEDANRKILRLASPPCILDLTLRNGNCGITQLPSPLCIFDLTLRDGKAEISALASPLCKTKNTWEMLRTRCEL